MQKLEEITGKHPVTPGEVLQAREILGGSLLKINQPSKALKAFELNLKRSPNRFNGLYGAAKAADLVGNKKKATMNFEQLLNLWAVRDYYRVPYDVMTESLSSIKALLKHP